MISTNFKADFLTAEEEERYKKHLTLDEIGFKGQLKLKNSSVTVSYTHLTLPTILLV